MKTENIEMAMRNCTYRPTLIKAEDELDEIKRIADALVGEFGPGVEERMIEE